MLYGCATVVVTLIWLFPGLCVGVLVSLVLLVMMPCTCFLYDSGSNVYILNYPKWFCVGPPRVDPADPYADVVVSGTFFDLLKTLSCELVILVFYIAFYPALTYFQSAG